MINSWAKMKMKRLPTDLKILNAIYDRYYDTFADFTKDDNSRSVKIYVPIDIKELAKNLKVDGDIIFGRLYYHLEKKHGYRQDDGSLVSFFSMGVGGDRHCVNFPLLASVLADLRQENRKFRIATAIAILALIISIVSLLISTIG